MEEGAEMSRYLLGFDIGGTFTDFVLLESKRLVLLLLKFKQEWQIVSLLEVQKV